MGGCVILFKFADLRRSPPEMVQVVMGAIPLSEGGDELTPGSYRVDDGRFVAIIGDPENPPPPPVDDNPDKPLLSPPDWLSSRLSEMARRLGGH